jgi:hypothetical protein
MACITRRISGWRLDRGRGVALRLVEVEDGGFFRQALCARGDFIRDRAQHGDGLRG